MLKAYFNLLYLFPNSKIIVEETRQGYHVKATGIERSTEQNLEVRRGLGDDAMRLKYDEFKHRIGLDEFVDTCFTMKKNRFGIYIVQETNPLSLPFKQ